MSDEYKKRKEGECSIEYLECCIGEYLNQDSNAISALNYAFVKCFLRHLKKLEGLSYPTVFSRISTLKLMKLYSCQEMKNTLGTISRRIDVLQEAISRVFPVVLSFRVKLLSRLTIHCASKHLPLEISLAWDPIFNLPYIPASSIKGLIRDYFESNKDKIISIGNYTSDDLFGTLEKSGLLVFFDAYPVECEGESLIEAEVLTPHYREAEYIIDEARSSPTPIIYPVVASGTILRFIIAVNDEKSSNASKILEGLENLVREALGEGIGAKTRLGYGRLVISGESSKSIME